MALEIERKFLVRLTKKPKGRGQRLTQGYLAKAENTIRLRRQAAKTILTVKGPGSLSRAEVEFVLSPKKAKDLWPLCTSALTKTRYKIGGWDIDIYHGALKGLVTAEYEMPNLHSALPPLPKGVEILAELTEQKGCSNASLAELATASPASAKATVKALYKQYPKAIKVV